jgi:hypothetical protein
MMYLQSIRSAVQQAVQEVIAAAGITDRFGGYWCALENGAEAILPELVGKVRAAEKARKYSDLCMEKAVRLWQMFREHSHVLSWQSRDPDNGLWGGAVMFTDDRGRKWILSFSGLPEAADEAAMLLAGARAIESMKRAQEIAAISSNATFLDHDWAEAA